jgi:hypothetical protein
MAESSGNGKVREIEERPVGWQRFEQAVDAAIKSRAETSDREGSEVRQEGC